MSENKTGKNEKKKKQRQTQRAKEAASRKPSAQSNLSQRHTRRMRNVLATKSTLCKF